MPVRVVPGAGPWSSPGRGDLAAVGVVVLHGFTGNPVSVRPLAEALASDGFAVDVPRLPGHGTRWRDLARTRYRDWLGAAERAADRLAASCEHVVLGGLSMGGTIALDIASRRGAASTAGVVAVNPLVLDRTDPAGRFAGLLQYAAPFVPARAAGITPNDIKRGGDERAYPVVSARAGYSLTRQLPALRQRLRSLDVPVLLLGSVEDHTVPPRNHEALAELLPDVEYVRLEDSYHVATLDNDAELVAERISRFARRVTGAG